MDVSVPCCEGFGIGDGADALGPISGDCRCQVELHHVSQRTTRHEAYEFGVGNWGTTGDDRRHHFS